MELFSSLMVRISLVLTAISCTDANEQIEVMSGMGRCGALHAWQREDVVPDIQTIAKGLGGGYAPIAAMLINHRVADVLKEGTGYGNSFHCVCFLQSNE
jgi:adenosylmethionine-8-amino-7-oxononanoate aminotransferase